MASEQAHKIDGAVRKLRAVMEAFDMKGTNRATMLNAINTIEALNTRPAPASVEDELYRAGMARKRNPDIAGDMPDPAPAATDTGLETVAFQHRRIDKYGVVGDWRPYKRDLFGSDRIESREFVTRSQAEELLAAKDQLIQSLNIVVDNFKSRTNTLKADNAAKDARIKAFVEYEQEAEGVKELYLGQIEALETKLAAAEKALEPFANAADGRKSKSVTGSVCFSQHYLLAARAVRDGEYDTKSALKTDVEAAFRNGWEKGINEAARNCEREAGEVSGLIDDVAYHLKSRAKSIRGTPFKTEAHK